MTAALRVEDDDAMITVANPAGRVCLARFVPPFDVAQVDKLAAEIRAILVALTRPAIFCSDIRTAAIFPPDVSDRITRCSRATTRRWSAAPS